MPVPSLFGVFATGGSRASFGVGTGYSVSGASQVVSFAGAAAGQLAIIIVNFATSASPPAGWTQVTNFTWPTFGYRTCVYYKVLTAGDISTGSVTVTGLQTTATCMALFYAGASALASVQTATTTTASLAIPGFTKSVNCKGIVGYCTTRAVASTPGAPGTMTNRIANFATANFKSRADDILTPSNYTNGSTLTYTTVGTTEAAGGLLELT